MYCISEKRGPKREKMIPSNLSCQSHAKGLEKRRAILNDLRALPSFSLALKVLRISLYDIINLINQEIDQEMKYLETDRSSSRARFRPMRDAERDEDRACSLIAEMVFSA